MNVVHDLEVGMGLSIAGHSMLVRDLAVEDMHAVVALHRLVFGPGAGADTDWYRWKYGAGQGEAVGVFHEGTLIAHCGGLARFFQHNGQLRTCMQIGDVMVAPHWRGLLTRRGPFFHVSNEFYQSRLGTGRAYEIGYGFPSDRHIQLAIQTGLLWNAGTVYELKWRLGGDAKLAGNLMWSTEPVAPQAPEFDALVAKAWHNMQRTVGSHMVGQRDPRYVRWRYADRPGSSPLFLVFRRSWRSEPLGVAVLGAITPGKAAHWLDWIGPVNQIKQACLLCQAAALKHGASAMLTWASEAVDSLLHDSGVYERHEAARIGIPSNSALNPDAKTSTDWWLMSGDTDFL